MSKVRRPRINTPFDYAMEMAEIADALGLSRQRVDQLLKKALRKAKKVVEKHGYKREDIFP